LPAHPKRGRFPWETAALWRQLTRRNVYESCEGKTALCTHLAEYAARKGLHVLAVDLDGQGNLSRNLTQDDFDKDTASVYGLFTNEPALPMPLTRIEGEIALYTGDQRLVEVDETPSMKPELLGGFLRSWAPMFDLCVIDPPPTLGKRLRAALLAADGVVMPFVPARGSIDGLGDLLDTVDAVRNNGNDKLKVLGLLANKANSRSKAEAKILRDLRVQLGSLLMPMQVNERASIAEALAQSRPVWARSGGASQRLAVSELETACAAILKNLFEGA
jgi:chromosome partitioning protein